MAVKTTLSQDEIKSNCTSNNLKVALLVCVEGDNNANKFYHMYEQPNGVFFALRGRIDSSSVIEGPYPMSKWESTYKSKTKASKKPKPYTDQTALFVSESTVTKNGTKKQSSNYHSKRTSAVIDFVNQLQKYANQSVQENYSVSASSVTKKQVDTAQETLNKISGMLALKADTKEINDTLLQLYQIIPRKMKNVRDYLMSERDNDNKKLFKSNKINSDEDLQFAKDMIGREQDTLDVMAGQVAVEEQEKKDHVTNDTQKKEYDLLHAMNLEMEDCDSKELQMIKNMLDQNTRNGYEKYSNYLKRAFRVRNNKTEEAYNKFLDKASNKKTELLWHGSRHENWWSIFQQGLVLRPTNAIITGKMFGYGIYFADKAQKSINYTSFGGAVRSYTGGSSNSAILAIYEIHQGKQYEITRHKSEHSQLTGDKMKKLGYDSVYAKGGYDLVNNEYIVYDDRQCTIKYIVEICK